MKLFINIVILCSLHVFYATAKDTYKAGVINNKDVDLNGQVPFILEAGKQNVDVLVMTSQPTGSEDNYDETVKKLSEAAKEAGLYIVAHLNEKVRCQNKEESIRSNLVFDRQGTVASVYRKPINTVVNCTAPTPGLVSFTTDFGVTFGLLMEEDLVLKNVECLKDVRNFLLTGAWNSEIPFLSARQFSPSWAYANAANLVTPNGVYSGKTGQKTGFGGLLVAELNKTPEDHPIATPVIESAAFNKYPGEDLSQYTIRPLNVELGEKGYKETVCHNSFCCEFYVKTSASKQQDVNYGLAAFEGVRHYDSRRRVAARSCAVRACAGLYKRSCELGSENNNTNITFEKLSVTANFSKQSVQYPVIYGELSNNDRFRFVTKSEEMRTKQVTAELTQGHGVLSFGIFGRDFSKDVENSGSYENQHDGLTSDIYDYLYNEDVQEFFDYVWIRLRIVMLVVSIYILEMM